ncbi:MAG: hypothetical protein AAF986_01570, partial [Pseudomonadota bacterium]
LQGGREDEQRTGSSAPGFGRGCKSHYMRESLPACSSEREKDWRVNESFALALVLPRQRQR